MEKERRKKKKINVVGTALLKHQQWLTKQRIAGADACNGEKSLIYFNDAKEQETPLMFDEITWDQVKKILLMHIWIT
jgi:hypothetical protein